jgi:DNA repair protein RecO
MGYRDASGLILRRRDVFEDDQEISLLTSSGCVSVRAPHARRSQKTFCGRLEPPNDVVARLYRSKEQSQWVVSSLTIDDVFADLLRDRTVRDRLWPVLSLFRDLFPAGESPGHCLPHLKKGLNYLKQGFEPVSLVTNRVLAMAAKRSGIAFETADCRRCGKSFGSAGGRGSVTVTPESGIVCDGCDSDSSTNGNDWSLSLSALKLFERLTQSTWEEVCANEIRGSDLDELEEILYRLFHYHFEISLESLKVRNAL